MTEADEDPDRDRLQAILRAIVNPQPRPTVLAVSQRKRILLGCTYVRRIWTLLPDDGSRHVVEVAERFADQQAALVELQQAVAAVRGAWPESTLTGYVDDGQSARANAAWAAVAASDGEDGQAAEAAARAVEWSARSACVHPTRDRPRDVTWAVAKRAGQAERAIQSGLYGHLIHNRFAPQPPPAAQPEVVLSLAAALYDRHDCAFALHDALLEAGQETLAEHFRESEHPRGCWALDLVLGKS